jgi:hypothetical protein
VSTQNCDLQICDLQICDLQSDETDNTKEKPHESLHSKKGSLSRIRVGGANIRGSMLVHEFISLPLSC